MPDAYFNGRWVDDATLSIPVGDLGFAMGVTVTERLRTFHRQPFRQAEHVERMRHSLEIVGLPLAIADEIDHAIGEFVTRNQPHWREGDEWAIVAFATPGSGSESTRCVHGFPLPFGDWADYYADGVSLWVSDFRQTPADCWPPELKCRSRMHYYLADQQARSKQPGARALLLDQEGYVGEASTANIVLYREGEGVLSPKLSKVLPGVSVSVVREIADQLSIPFVERDLTVQELTTADEVWLCSTSVCMQPVVECDGKPIADSKPGTLYKQFMRTWGEIVGLDITSQARKHAHGNE